MEEKPEIEILSPEVQEILGHPPHWLLRSGITVILLIILLFLAASWFIKYPDIIMAPVEITATNPPSKLVARNSGKMDEIYCSDRQIVDSGQVLAIIKNPASSSEIYCLKSWLIKIKPWIGFHDSLLNVIDSLKNTIPSLSLLGETQSAYELFIKSIVEFSTFKNLDAKGRKTESLEKQKLNQLEYIKNINKQNKITQKQYKLAQSQFRRDSLLFKGGALAEGEFEKSRSTLLESGYRNNSGQMAGINAEIQYHQIEQQIIDLQVEQQKEKEMLSSLLTSSYSGLLNAIEKWEYNYVFIASQQARISFNQLWSVNQNIRVGETLLSLIPLKSLKISAKAKISMSGSGKIKPDQKVNIKLYNYPYQEFGMIEGQLVSISEAPSDSSFTANISLPDGLVTNYKKQIPFSQGLSGQAEIITDDLNLFIRFFNPIKALLYDKVKF